MTYNWRRIAVPRTEVDLKTLLSCGQSFTWRETGENIWSNVLQSRLFSVRQTDSELLWCVHCDKQEKPPAGTVVKHEPTASVDASVKSGSKPLKKGRKSAVKTEVSDVISSRDEGPTASKISKLDVKSFGDTVTDNDVKSEAILRDYFQLSINLGSLYVTWSEADTHFAKIAESFPGIRILRQDPTENLFSFICSSNNHISRISSMVLKLSENYGTRVGTVGDIDFYSFPEAADLCGSGVEQKLRELGFGYRAKFIAKTAKIMHEERSEGWLHTLRTLPYDECIAELVKLQGVGRKVADCVALMSLDKPHVVPVDTHVLQIAARDYRIPGISKDMKSLTPAIHDKIAKYFVDLYGDYAGWAHTVLFAADLRQFSDKVRPAEKKSSAGKTKSTPSKAKSAAGKTKLVAGKKQTRKSKKD